MNTDTDLPDGDTAAIASAVRSRLRRRAFLAGLLLFVGGLIIGGGGMSFYLVRTVFAASPTPERIGEMLFRNISRDVPVSDGELRAIRGQVDSHVGAMAASNREYGEYVRRQFGELCTSICAILGRERALRWKAAMRQRYGERAGEYIHMNDCHFDGEGECSGMDPEDLSR
ncbi:MAG: hypothetical protein LUE17_00710 [Planctomycetaceae bacterium]|nr:hypothetical protein [Planctomycetaceae bacterium]